MIALHKHYQTLENIEISKDFRNTWSYHSTTVKNHFSTVLNTLESDFGTINCLPRLPQNHQTPSGKEPHCNVKSPVIYEDWILFTHHKEKKHAFFLTRYSLCLDIFWYNQKAANILRIPRVSFHSLQNNWRHPKSFSTSKLLKLLGYGSKPEPRPQKKKWVWMAFDLFFSQYRFLDVFCDPRGPT